MSVHKSLETAAQLFVDHPAADDVDSIVAMLDDDIRAHYSETEMLAHRPAKAEFMIARGKRSAAWTAMWHLATAEMIGKVLPAIQADDGLIVTHPQSDGVGQYHAFIDTGAAYLSNGTASILNGTAQSTDQDYSPLWNTIGNSQDELRKAWLDLQKDHVKQGNKTRLSPPKAPAGSESISRIWMSSARDIASSGLWVLVNQRMCDPMGSESTAAELMQRALAAIPITSWATSINRSVTLKLFPNLFVDIPDLLDNTFFSGPNDLFIPSDEGTSSPCRWAHPSLQKGPWQYPGWCAGRASLKAPTPEMRGNVEKLYSIAETAGDMTIHRDEEGSFSNGTAFLIIGSFIAKHSIFTEPQIDKTTREISK